MQDHDKRKNPWLGLESYREGEVLYGRDDDIRDLGQSVLNDSNVLLYGKSGIGKSSILNAGVIPAMRRHGFLPVPVRLSHKDSRGYLVQIHEAIAAAIIPPREGEDAAARAAVVARCIREVVPVRDASAVTSGVYERCFERDGVFYHHILDPKTGFPVETDAAGATVVARRSIDAEGYSTTLLALGIERGLAFARERDAILGAYFVDRDGKVAGIA